MISSLRWYRYIWSEVAGPTFIGLLLWTFVLLMNAFFLVAEKALSKGLGWELALRMFSYEVPRLLVLSIPMSVLLGCLIAIGRLSADHEWVALQGAGFGPSRLLRPLLVWGLGASLIALLIYGVLVPRANYAGRRLFGEILFVSSLAADLRAGVFYTQLPGTVMFVENIRSGEEGRLQGVFLHRSNPRQDGLDEIILARGGDLVPVPDGSGRLSIRLRTGVLHRYDPNEPATYQKTRFRDYDDELPAHQFLRGLRDDPVRSVADMGLIEVFREVRSAREALTEANRSTEDRARSQRLIEEIRLRNAAFEMHRRIALPLACLLFAALALPLGVRRARSGKGAGFAVSLLVILLYWVIFTFSMNLARGGKIPPWFGAWSANLVLAPWAILGYWRLRRHSAERSGWLAPLLGLFSRTLRLLAPRSTATPTHEEDSADSSAPPLAALTGTSRRFIGRLDRYVGLHYLRMVTLTLLGAITIYSVVELKALIDGAIENEQPISLLVGYFVFAWPGMLNLAVPVACLVGAMVTFTLLTRTGELTAVRAAGISSQRALLPVLVVTAALCGGLFLVQDQVLFRWGDGQSATVGWAITRSTNKKADEIKDRIMGRAPVTRGMPAGGQWAFGEDGDRLYHYRLYDPDKGIFQGLSVLTLDRVAPRILDHRFTPTARWSAGAWSVEGGWYWRFPADATAASYEQTPGQARLALSPPEQFARREAILATRQSTTLQEQMSSAELVLQIDALSTSGYDTDRLEVALWGKLAQSVTPLVMVLLGLPFAFRVGRRGSLYGLGVAILLVIVYWATFAVFNGLGLEGILSPALAAWTPNILYGTLGAYLMLYVPT